MSDRHELARRLVSREEIESFALRCLEEEQVECPVRHIFAPGVYYREFTVPRGTFVIGRCHKTEFLNFLLRGKATVLIGGTVHQLTAPAVIPSGTGINKVAIVHEEMVWGTVHANPTDERDLTKLEEMLVEPLLTFSEVDAAELKGLLEQGKTE